MLTDKLYDSVLLEPARNGADSLAIVTGYTSPAMAMHHLNDLQKAEHNVSVELFYGMMGGKKPGSKKPMVPFAEHNGFLGIQKDHFPGGYFTCMYNAGVVEVHAKVYVWRKGNKPVQCFVGSANYSQKGFLLPSRQETMTEADPKKGEAFYRRMLRQAIWCGDKDVGKHINIDKHGKPPAPPESESVESSGVELGRVELSLLNTRTGETHETAGLNWGHRDGRDRNQAYIPVPQQVVRSKFFPEKGICFSSLTDDGKTIYGNIAQDQSKAIHSVPSNAILGKYFRERLGLKDGEFVTRKHLDDYGRTSVTFVKMEDGTYRMDFASPKGKAKKGRG